MEGDAQLLKEMKAIKTGWNSCNIELPDSVGGVDAEQDIKEMFREAYETLFNSAPSGQEMVDMKIILNYLISVTAKHIKYLPPIMSVYGPRNWPIMSVSGPRNNAEPF